MIFLITGGDADKRREARAKIIKVNTNENPFVSRVNDSDFSEPLISGLIFDQPLFFEERVVVMEDVLSEDNFIFLKKFLPDMESSGTIFLFEQESVSAPITKAITAHSKDIVTLTKIAKAKPKPLGFPWAFAVLSKDKKKSWVMLEDAVSSGASAEELLGILFWQIKTVILVKMYENNQKILIDSGVSPYSISQAKTLAKNWTLPELQKMSSELLCGAQEGRRKGEELKVVLERFVLR